MQDLTNIFSNFAFPTALTISFLIFFSKKLYPDFKAFLEKISKALEKVTKTNESLSKTNEILVEKLEEKLEEVDGKLMVMNAKFDIFMKMVEEKKDDK